MTDDDLIRQYGDELRCMEHAEYAKLAAEACGDHPAVMSAVRLARENYERRFTNVIRGHVLRYLHQVATGDGAEMDTRGLQLF